MIGRRGLLGAFLAAPVIIRTPGLLMPVRPMKLMPPCGKLEIFTLGGELLCTMPISQFSLLVSSEEPVLGVVKKPGLATHYFLQHREGTLIGAVEDLGLARNTPLLSGETVTVTELQIKAANS